MSAKGFERCSDVFWSFMVGNNLVNDTNGASLQVVSKLMNLIPSKREQSLSEGKHSKMVFFEGSTCALLHDPKWCYVDIMKIS